MEWVHTLGAAIGIFSRHANEEHEKLLNLSRMVELAQKCNLQIILYRRFLFGANQMVVLKRKKKYD